MSLALVESWHAALAAGDADGLLAVSAPDVEIRGPRGVARGHAVLREWAGAAGAALEPRRWFCGTGGRVVVAQVATWPGPGGGRTPPLAVATSFTVRDGAIARIARHDDLAAALAHGGLSERDEVRRAR